MTRTAQPRSLATLIERNKDLNIQKPETEEIMSNLLSLLDSLNDISKNLAIAIDLTQKCNSIRVAELPYLQEIQRLIRSYTRQ